MQTPTPFDLVIELARNNVTGEGGNPEQTAMRNKELDAIYAVEEAYPSMKEALEEARNVLVNQQFNAAKTLAGESYFAMTGLDSTIMKIQHALTLAEGA
jgi:hypothetical protein